MKHLPVKLPKYLRAGDFVQSCSEGDDRAPAEIHLANHTNSNSNGSLVSSLFTTRYAPTLSRTFGWVHNFVLGCG